MLLFIILFIIIIAYIFTGQNFNNEDFGFVKKGGSDTNKCDCKKYIACYKNILDDNSPRSPYISDDHKDRITHKAGQLKLLLGEIEFYTYLKSQGVNNIIYIGSAPGHHSVFIAEMFPDFNFVYYDPRPFTEALYNYPNITLINAFFNSDTILPQHIIHPYAFVSDIRSGTYESYVEIDMANQQQWVLQLQPEYAMLKFRLPWSTGSTQYFDGDIHPQAYSGARSTETRLWVKKSIKSDYKMKSYNNDNYNNMMFHYNKYTRIAYYDNPNANIDHCRDCWLYVKILKDYNIAYPHLARSFTDYYNWFGYDLNQSPHNLLPDERDICKKLKILENIIETEVNKIADSYINRNIAIANADTRRDNYIHDIEKLRISYATDEKSIYSAGLFNWMAEIEKITEYVNSNPHKKIVIVTDYLNDYIIQLSRLPAKFYVFYNHNYITNTALNVTIIYDIPRENHMIKKDTAIWFNFIDSK